MKQDKAQLVKQQLNNALQSQKPPENELSSVSSEEFLYSVDIKVSGFTLTTKQGPLRYSYLVKDCHLQVSLRTNLPNYHCNDAFVLKKTANVTSNFEAIEMNLIVGSCSAIHETKPLHVIHVKPKATDTMTAEVF